MKKIFLFLLGTGLFISCNNNSSDTKKDEVTKDAKDNNTVSKKGWSADEKKQFMDECVKNNKMDDGSESKVNQICSCLMDKAEANFSSYDEIKKGGKNAEYQKGKADCEAQFPGN